MTRRSLINYLIAAGFVLCAALASSWYGAVLYVRSYPNIVEYTVPLEFRDTTGRKIERLRPGQSVILHGWVHRQPYSCWGSFTYGLRGDVVGYQFPPVRSQGLKPDVHDWQIKHLFTIPEGMPPGRYRLLVTIYPTCDGVDIRPTTTEFETWIEIIS